MFPQTKHVETLVALSQVKPDATINVKIEFGEEEGKLSLNKLAERLDAENTTGETHLIKTKEQHETNLTLKKNLNNQ